MLVGYLNDSLLNLLTGCICVFHKRMRECGSIYVCGVCVCEHVQLGGCVGAMSVWSVCMHETVLHLSACVCAVCVLCEHVW